MNPFQTPFDRLTSVDAPARKPSRNALWWGDVTAVSLFIGGAVMVAVWWFV